MELCCQTRGTNFAGNFFAPNPEDAKGMFMKRNKERNKDLAQFSHHGGWGSLNNGSLKFFMDKTTVHVTHMRSFFLGGTHCLWGTRCSCCELGWEGFPVC